MVLCLEIWMENQFACNLLKKKMKSTSHFHFSKQLNTRMFTRAQKYDPSKA